MKPNLKQNITRNLLNIRGWRTNRKIVVIESDDWGTIRMASKEAYDYFVQKKLPVDKCPYSSNDSLESNKDLEGLFDILTSVKDKNGNPAVLTANNIVANPDFDKIKAANFDNYFYEPFSATLSRYPAHNRVLELYREGIKQNIFKPQFHGREHLNIERWLKVLQSGDTAALQAFEQHMFTVHTGPNPVHVNEFMDALDADSPEQLQQQKVILEEGLQLFQQLWGYRSTSFIAPCYIWSSSIEPVLAANGVQYLQGVVNQLEPVLQPGYQYKKKYHYQGQKNKSQQVFLVRNAFFEPSMNPSFDWMSDCLHRMETAFRWNKPAIISTHRLNFLGFINPKNRSANLPLFAQLLKTITQRWPQVEFMSSDQLGELMQQKNDRH